MTPEPSVTEGFHAFEAARVRTAPQGPSGSTRRGRSRIGTPTAARTGGTISKLACARLRGRCCTYVRGYTLEPPQQPAGQDTRGNTHWAGLTGQDSRGKTHGARLTGQDSRGRTHEAKRTGKGTYSRGRRTHGAGLTEARTHRMLARAHTCSEVHTHRHPHTHRILARALADKLAETVARSIMLASLLASMQHACSSCAVVPHPRCRRSCGEPLPLQTRARRGPSRSKPPKTLKPMPSRRSRAARVGVGDRTAWPCHA